MDNCIGCIPNLKLQSLLTSDCHDRKHTKLNKQKYLLHNNETNIDVKNEKNNESINNNDDDHRGRKNLRSSILRKLFRQKNCLDVEQFEQPLLERAVGSGGITIIPITQGDLLVGKSEKLKGTAYYIEGCEVEDRHCFIVRKDLLVFLYPIAPSTFVDGHRVIKSTKLEHNSLLSFGTSNHFRFHHPSQQNPNNVPGYLTHIEIQELHKTWKPNQKENSQSIRHQTQIHEIKQQCITKHSIPRPNESSRSVTSPNQNFFTSSRSNTAFNFSNSLPYNIPSGKIRSEKYPLTAEHPQTTCSVRKLADNDVLHLSNHFQQQTAFDTDSDITSNSIDSFNSSSSSAVSKSLNIYRNEKFIKNFGNDKFENLKFLLLAQATQRLHKKKLDASVNSFYFNQSSSSSTDNKINSATGGLPFSDSECKNSTSPVQDCHSCSSLRTFNPVYSAHSTDISNSSSLQRTPPKHQHGNTINKPTDFVESGHPNQEFYPQNFHENTNFANKIISFGKTAPHLQVHSIYCLRNFILKHYPHNFNKFKSLSDTDLLRLFHQKLSYKSHKSCIDLQISYKVPDYKIILDQNNLYEGTHKSQQVELTTKINSETIGVKEKVVDTKINVAESKNVNFESELQKVDEQQSLLLDSKKYSLRKQPVLSSIECKNNIFNFKSENIFVDNIARSSNTLISCGDKNKKTVLTSSKSIPIFFKLSTKFDRMDDKTNGDDQDVESISASQLDLQNLYEIQKNERLEEEKRAVDEQKRLDDLLCLCNKMGFTDKTNVQSLDGSRDETPLQSSAQPSAQNQNKLPSSVNPDLAAQSQNKEIKSPSNTLKSQLRAEKPNDDINFNKTNCTKFSNLNGPDKEFEESSFLIDGMLKQGLDVMKSDSEDGGRISPVADSGVEFCSPDWSQVSQRSFQQQQQQHQQQQSRISNSYNKTPQHFRTAPSTFDYRCASEDRRLPSHPLLSASLSSSNFIGHSKNSQRNIYHSYHRSPVNHYQHLMEPKLHRFGSDSRITSRQRWDDSSQELQLLRDLQRDVMQNISDIKNKISDCETQQNEALRELEVEKALLDGERDILLDQLNASKSKINSLEENAQENSLASQQSKLKDQNVIKQEKSKLKELESTRRHLQEALKVRNKQQQQQQSAMSKKDSDKSDATTTKSENADGATETEPSSNNNNNNNNAGDEESKDEMIRKLEEAREAEETQRFLVDNLEFQMLEGESKDEEEREKMEKEIRMEREELINLCLQYQTTLDQIASQQADLLRQVNEDIDEMQSRKELLQQQLMKEDSILMNINQQMDMLLQFASTHRMSRERISSLSRAPLNIQSVPPRHHFNIFDDLPRYPHHHPHHPPPHHHNNIGASSLSSTLDGGWWRASSQTLPRLDHPQHLRSKYSSPADRIAMNLYEEEKRFHHYPSKAKSSMITPIKMTSRDWSKVSPSRGLAHKTASWLAGTSDTEDSTSESENHSDKAISSLSSREEQMEKIKDMECQLLLARAEKIKLIESQKQQREKEQELLEEERRKRKEAEMMMIIMKKKKKMEGDDVDRVDGQKKVPPQTSSSTSSTTLATVRNANNTWSDNLLDKHQNRPLTRYLPTKDPTLDLVTFITSCGHNVDQCRHVMMTSSSCRGLLTKMTEGLGGRMRSWKKRWFVFDRSKKCLSYYADSKESKPPRNIIYFQSIEDVFVDHLHQVNSPTPQLTFCLKTFDRMYYFVAPSSDAMRIWIDVLFTGAEGHQNFL